MSFESGNLINSSLIFVKLFLLLLTVDQFNRFVVLLLSYKTKLPTRGVAFRFIFLDCRILVQYAGLNLSSYFIRYT